MSAMRARCLFLVLAAVACGKGKDDGKATGSAAASGSSLTKTVEGGEGSDGSAETPAAAGSAGSAKPAVGSAAPPAAPSAARDPEAAKAANSRGMQLHTAKKYKEAMAEFEKAIAADDSFVLAHYNLACAASRAQEADVAERELTWVNSAGSWNDAAAAATKKAPTDPDLAWFFGQGEGQMASFLQKGEPIVVDLADVGGNRTEPAVAPDAAKALAAAPGKHDDQCDPADQKQAHVHAVPMDKRVVYASLRDGIAWFDGAKLVSRTDPIGCTGPGASQDSIESVDTTAYTGTGGPTKDLVVVRYSNGGHRSFTDNITIAAFKDDDHLVRAFDATLATSDDDKPGTLVLTLNGDIVLGQPGAKQKRVFRWNAGTSKFEEVKVN